MLHVFCSATCLFVFLDDEDALFENLVCAKTGTILDPDTHRAFDSSVLAQRVDIGRKKRTTNSKAKETERNRDSQVAGRNGLWVNPSSSCSRLPQTAPSTEQAPVVAPSILPSTSNAGVGAPTPGLSNRTIVTVLTGALRPYCMFTDISKNSHP